MLKRRVKFSVNAAAIAGALVLTGAGLGIVTAAPASAALPTCDIGVSVPSTGNTVAAIPAKSKVGVHCQLTEGNAGEGVRKLQDALRACNGGDITPDGRFGERTKEALKKAQRAAGVSADGMYGPTTRDAIKWSTRSAGGDTPTGCKRIKGYE